MGRLALAILGTTTAFALSGGAASADVTQSIFDGPEYDQTTGVDYSHGYYPGAQNWTGHLNPGSPSLANGGGWFDNISGTGFYDPPPAGGDNIPPFWSSGADVTWSNMVNGRYQDVTITLYTNMPATGISGFGIADVFFDLNWDGSYNTGNSWDYGLDINSGTGTDGYGGPGAALYAGGGTEAILYQNPTFKTAADFGEIKKTQVCSDNGNGTNTCGNPNDARAPETEVTGGTPVGNPVTVSQTVLDQTPGTTPTDQPYYEYTITLAGINDGTHGDWNAFRLFWGTGQCANDTVEGYVAAVPVPAALPIIASALVGFGFAGWRQRETFA
jgi:hypothetical protein